MLFQFVTSLHIFICAVLIILVLVQQGQGADAGVSLGGGGGNTFFGASGADSFITRFTTFIAFGFMLTSVYLSLNSKPSSPTAGRLFKNAPTAVSVSKEVTVPKETTTNKLEDTTGKFEDAPAEMKMEEAPMKAKSMDDKPKAEKAMQDSFKTTEETSDTMSMKTKPATQPAVSPFARQMLGTKKMMADKVEGLKDSISNMSNSLK